MFQRRQALLVRQPSQRTVLDRNVSLENLLRWASSSANNLSVCDDHEDDSDLDGAKSDENEDTDNKNDKNCDVAQSTFEKCEEEHEEDDCGASNRRNDSDNYYDGCKGDDINSDCIVRNDNRSNDKINSHARPQDDKTNSKPRRSIRRSRRRDAALSSSDELKHSELLQLQKDGTLAQLSTLDLLDQEESFIAKQTIWKRLAIQASQTSHTSILGDEDDVSNSQKELIHRATFIMLSSLTVLAGAVWGVMYLFLREYVAALMPFAYCAIMGTVLFTCVFRARGRYELFVTCQLCCILILPFAVHVALGGVRKSGGVMLWSFLCPMGAAFFRSAEESLRWFGIYAAVSASLLFWDLWTAVGSSYGNGNDIGYAEDGIVTQLYFFMNVLGLKSIVFAAVFLFAKDLEKEYTKSEEVLRSIMPPAILKRIKRGEFPIVDHVHGVSILFADLVGFTKASADLHPNFLVGLFLNDLFHSFDVIVYKHGLEKIKTIGDAYMVVGGLNHGQSSSYIEKEESAHQHHSYCNQQQRHSTNNNLHHCERIMLLALDMFQELKRINAKYKLDFELRVGVHIGPVVAGVLGRKRFTYDVWGDSVNTASRMESNGIPSSIHMSSDMYNIVRNMHQHFEFHPCGTKIIKGKGEMTTFVAKPLSSMKSDFLAI